ncbi:MAG: hypothetical protein A3I68_01020 [Candidatus Melainabacteria bacterium RIFCSPLOWO2_02_FULL_35_15]|nr:MAG: hypothetical protein A3F80_09225 [Candidatus Melainabacteria bacterium RIFCSPLOWO2_12_FULL_35_11]OGI13359.1 MAG: hypothetical protein A3I68_01020 [Candidatus Melainabacteria bacterium RIFCSPLOWO2_02_FULL_35_15]
MAINQELINYIQNQLVQSKYRINAFTKTSDGKLYPTRNIYVKLKQYVDDFIKRGSEKRWVIIPGLRGVGKTTVLAQIFLHLESTENESVNKLYFALDDAINILDVSLKDIIAGYEQLIGTSFEKLTKPTFIFIDEVQSDPKWAVTLKTLFDRTKKVFIFCSGSSALHLQTNADVARRAHLEKLFPMSFTEFQKIKYNVFPIKDLRQELKLGLYYSDDVEAVFDRIKSLENKVNKYWSSVDRLSIREYLSKGNLPFTINEPNDMLLYNAIDTLLDKIVINDIKELSKFSKSTLGTIKRLLFLLADSSDVLSLNKLSTLLSPTTTVTIANILKYLENAELLIRVLPYGSNVSKVKKPSKYLFMSPSIREQLLSISGNQATMQMRQGKLLEDASGLSLYREFVVPHKGSLTYDNSEKSADFILEIENKRKIAIEIGMGKKDGSQVKRTTKERKCNYGLVFSSSELYLDKANKMVKVPLDYFLLT